MNGRILVVINPHITNTLLYKTLQQHLFVRYFPSHFNVRCSLQDIEERRRAELAKLEERLNELKSR